MNYINLVNFLINAIRIYAVIRFLGIFLDSSGAGKKREIIFYLLCLGISTFCSITLPTDVDWILWMILLPGTALTYKESLRRKWGVVVMEEAIRILFGQVLGYVFLNHYPVLKWQKMLLDFFAVLLFLLLELFLERIVYTQREQKVQILERQLQMYSNEFGVIHRTQSQMQGLRHDMKHHTRMLKELICAQDQKGALDYLDRMQEFMEGEEETVSSGNETIDSIINYYLRDARELGTEICTDIQIPETLEFPVFDINVILGNLLENAVDALRNCRERKLAVRMKLDRGILLVCVENTYEGDIREAKGRLLTGKHDRVNHGIGLDNVKRIAGKYSGEVRFSYKEGRFRADVLLYIS